MDFRTRIDKELVAGRELPRFSDCPRFVCPHFPPTGTTPPLTSAAAVLSCRWQLERPKRNLVNPHFPPHRPEGIQVRRILSAFRYRNFSGEYSLGVSAHDPSNLSYCSHYCEPRNARRSSGHWHTRSTPRYSSRAQEAFVSFPHYWFIAALLFAFIAFVLSGVSFYRRDFLVGSYALLGIVSAFVYLDVMTRSIPIY